MTVIAGNPTPPGNIRGRDFYVTGGTLRPDAPSYVERKADRELFQGLLQGEFCYVLTSRQMGKSSLMVRAVQRLRQEGVAVAVLDLTAIGQNLTVEQWYDGLISRLGQQLELEDELLDFWQAHPELGPLQRWLTSLEKVVLEKLRSRVVIFVDEIDIVRSLPFSTDEFFAAIRESYNRRSRDPAFNRLAFGLLGVAAPTDLIRDTRMTPFNIGRRIELHDFTMEEARPLAQGLGPHEECALGLLERVMYWTDGHPYLTQRLCRALAESVYAATNGEEPGSLPPIIPTASSVDELAHKLFLSRQARERDDNLVFVRERILRSEEKVADLLYLYRRIRRGSRVADDETNPLITILRLAGVIHGKYGYVEVRNRIYFHVFDVPWTQANMPEAEVRRQRGARRKGVVLGLSIAVVLLLGYLVVVPVVKHYRYVRLGRTTAQNIERAYRSIASYKDSFVTTVEIGVGGMMIPSKASGSIVFDQPGNVNLTVKSDFTSPEVEFRLMSDSRVTTVFAPNLKQFRVEMGRGPTVFDLPGNLSRQVGPARILPVYRMFLDPKALARFSSEAQNIQYSGTAELDGKRYRVLTWEHSAAALIPSRPRARPGWGPPPPAVTHQGQPPAADADEISPGERPGVPVTAWVGSDNRIVQMRLDFSHWASELVGKAVPGPVNGLIITERHRNIETSLSPVEPRRFTFNPGPESIPVSEFQLPEPNLSDRVPIRKEFAQMIPPRLPSAPANLIDLTEWFNASLMQTWHPGLPENSLNALPTGILQFGDLAFDVRGIVQVSGSALKAAGGTYPQKIAGIRINQTCRELHFLQATGWKATDGTRVGAYTLHFADGQAARIQLVYGEDIRDWNADSDPSAELQRASVVWSAINNGRRRVRMFKMTWENPRPEVEIRTLDFESAMSEAAPFILAITAER
jgi:hypothetical protein